MKGSLSFWSKYLKVVSISMIIIGVYWAISGQFDPFGIYENYFSNHFWGVDERPADADTTFRFLMIPFGALIVGYFVFQYFMIEWGFPKRELWIWKTSVYAFLAWFCFDTLMCLIHGACFNIVIANLTTVFFMLPIFFMQKYFTNE